MPLSKRQEEVIKHLRRKIPRIEDVKYLGHNGHTMIQIKVKEIENPIKITISSSTSETLDRYNVVTEVRRRIRESSS